MGPLLGNASLSSRDSPSEKETRQRMEREDDGKDRSEGRESATSQEGSSFDAEGLCGISCQVNYLFA